MRYYYPMIACVFAFSIMLSSCRKEEPKMISSSLTELNIPTTCLNGQLDDGEWFIDCGGICSPCNQAAAPCENEADVLMVDGQSLNMNVTCSSSGSERTVSGSAPNYTLNLTFATPFPDVILGPPGTRSISTSSILSSTEVQVNLVFAGNNLTAGSGTVYLNYDENGFVLDLCNITASAQVGFTTVSRTFDAQLNCNF